MFNAYIHFLFLALSKDVSAVICQALFKNIDCFLNNEISYINVRLIMENWKNLFERHIGISELYLKYISSINLKNGIFQDFIDINIKDYSILQPTYCNALNNNFFKFENFSEEDCAARYNLLIYNLIMDLTHNEFANIPFIAHRNKALSESVKTTTSLSASNSSNLFATSDYNGKDISIALKRPDFWMSDNFGRILFKGEEKKMVLQIGEAKKQLLDYCFILDKSQYSDIRYTFGYVTGGNIVEIYMLDHQNINLNKDSLIMRYDLHTISDRLQIITNVISIYYICSIISKKYKPKDFYHYLYVDQVFALSTIQFIAYNRVLKTVVFELQRICAFQSTNGISDLLSFYDLIREDNSNSPIINTIRCCAYKYTPNTNLILLLTPICNIDIQSRTKSNLAEFQELLLCILNALQSIHNQGYLHNDIRWPNIVYCDDHKKYNKYLLIDFENLVKICKTKCRCKRENHIHKYPENDIYLFYNLLNKPYWDSNTDVSKFVNNLKIFLNQTEDKETCIKSIEEIIHFINNYII